MGYYDNAESGTEEREEKPMKCWLLPPTIYIVIGLFTFSHIYETSEKYDFGRGPGSVLGGIAWPVYWAGTGAIEAYRMATKMAGPMVCVDESGRTWRPRDGACRIEDRR